MIITTTTITMTISNNANRINWRLYNTPIAAPAYPPSIPEHEQQSIHQQQQQQHRFSSTSINILGDSGNNGSAGGHRGSIVSFVDHGPADRSLWRSGGADRTHQSLAHATYVMVVDGSSDSVMDEPDSPLLKYTVEDLEYSEPAHAVGRGKKLGLRYHRSDDGQRDGLSMQASTTLVSAVGGLICAGWLLDVIQVQSLAVGSVAGSFTFGLGVVVNPTTNNVNEIALMITASMLCAAMINSITCQLASPFEDLVALVILAGCSVSLQKYISTPLPVILLVILLGMITAWVMYVRRNKFVSEMAK
ncbi:hypothetical protein BGZ98_007828 [Dissophora globulifera]|nr:hypothetical protein BGZ98_007828 [Dissophora globulifera]